VRGGLETQIEHARVDDLVFDAGLHSRMRRLGLVPNGFGFSQLIQPSGRLVRLEIDVVFGLRPDPGEKVVRGHRRQQKEHFPVADPYRVDTAFPRRTRQRDFSMVRVQLYYHGFSSGPCGQVKGR
jgi:hypothetical protein